MSCVGMQADNVGVGLESSAQLLDWGASAWAEQEPVVTQLLRMRNEGLRCVVERCAVEGVVEVVALPQARAPFSFLPLFLDRFHKLMKCSPSPVPLSVRAEEM